MMKIRLKTCKSLMMCASIMLGILNALKFYTRFSIKGSAFCNGIVVFCCLEIRNFFLNNGNIE